MKAPRRIILTREQEQCRAWRRVLDTTGIDVLCLPLIRFSPVDPPSDLDPSSFDWILFRSPNSVRAFWDTNPTVGEARLGVLGKGTADALRACGRESDLDEFFKTGADMAAAFVKQMKAPARILLPGPAEPLEEPRSALTAAGFEVREVPFYRTEAVPPNELPDSPFSSGDLIFFASPSAVRAYVAAWEVATPCIAIGETTAVAARKAGFEVSVAANPTLEAMILAAGIEPHTPSQPTESLS